MGPHLHARFQLVPVPGEGFCWSKSERNHKCTINRKFTRCREGQSDYGCTFPKRFPVKWESKKGSWEMPSGSGKEVAFCIIRETEAGYSTSLNLLSK